MAKLSPISNYVFQIVYEHLRSDKYRVSCTRIRVHLYTLNCMSSVFLWISNTLASSCRLRRRAASVMNVFLLMWGGNRLPFGSLFPHRKIDCHLATHFPGGFPRPLSDRKNRMVFGVGSIAASALEAGAGRPWVSQETLKPRESDGILP